MQQMVTFVRNDVMPSWWANAIQRFLSGLAGNVVARRIDDVTVEVDAGPDDEAVVVNVEGRWRWREAPVQRAHPGGAAGKYALWVTAAENDIDNVPAVGTDNTNYAFDLAITADAGAPAANPGVVDLWTRIADVWWDGDSITGIDMLLGPASGTSRHAAAHAVGGDDALTPAAIGAATAAALAALAANPVVAGNGIAVAGNQVSANLGDGSLAFTGGQLVVNSDQVTIERGAFSLRIKDGGVTLAKLAAALKPSAGAADGVEAVRALGTGAGQAAAGLNPSTEGVGSFTHTAALAAAAHAFTFNAPSGANNATSNIIRVRSGGVDRLLVNAATGIVTMPQEVNIGPTAGHRVRIARGDLGHPGLEFARAGGAFNTNLYAPADTELRTDGHLEAAFNVYARVGMGGETRLGIDNVTPGIVFGADGATRIIKLGNGFLNTESSLALGTQAVAARATLDVAAGHALIWNLGALGFRNVANTGWSHYFQHNGPSDTLRLMSNNGTIECFNVTPVGALNLGTGGQPVISSNLYVTGRTALVDSGGAGILSFFGANGSSKLDSPDQNSVGAAPGVLTAASTLNQLLAAFTRMHRAHRLYGLLQGTAWNI